MNRWLLLAAAAVVTTLVLGAVAASPALHTAGDADCPELDDPLSNPVHGSYESDMYADENGSQAACPVDDGAGMGAAAPAPSA